MDELFVVKIENGVPTKGVMRYENMRMMFPNTSFPEKPSLELLAAFEFAPWLFTPQPFPSEKKVVFEDDPVLTGGIWQQVWSERDMNAEELAIATEQKWADVRQTRTNLLYNSDWTQIADAPLTTQQKQVWANYRQILRDLPDSITDPFSVTWPTEPQ